MSAISVRWLSISWGAVIFETNYGLMQHSHFEIKNKLLNALDEDYNVSVSYNLYNYFRKIIVIFTMKRNGR